MKVWAEDDGREFEAVKKWFSNLMDCFEVGMKVVVVFLVLGIIAAATMVYVIIVGPFLAAFFFSAWMILGPGKIKGRWTHVMAMFKLDDVFGFD